MRLLSCAILFAGLFASPAWAVESAAKSPAPAPAAGGFVEKLVTPALMQKIRQGGYVLYMRHGYTDNSRPDRFPNIDLNDCNTQRPLSDAGRILMKQVGQAIRKAQIPLNEILVSPMCRTRESAELAIGNKFDSSEPLMYSANMTSEEKKPRIAALKKILAAAVKPGGNRLLIAHAPNMDDLIGFFIKPEGTIIVFSQTGPEGFEYQASIHPDDWDRLDRSP